MPDPVPTKDEILRSLIGAEAEFDDALRKHQEAEARFEAAGHRRYAAQRALKGWIEAEVAREYEAIQRAAPDA